jgi:hypothetical protein
MNGCICKHKLNINCQGWETNFQCWQTNFQSLLFSTEVLIQQSLKCDDNISYTVGTIRMLGEQTSTHSQ